MNAEKWPNIVLLETLWCEQQGFLKYVRPFFNIMHERLKEHQKVAIKIWKTNISKLWELWCKNFTFFESYLETVSLVKHK